MPESADHSPASTIRPYQAGDRDAIRHICAATCWMGEYRPELIPDDWIWAEYWTRYFTDRESENTWVSVDANNRVGGYLTGTADVRRAHSYAARLLPGIVWHVIRHRLMRKQTSRRALMSMLHSMLFDPPSLPGNLATQYPATWHFDLLAHARGGGTGGRLYRRFYTRMRELGVPGIHAQVLNLNRTAGEFLIRMGFTHVHSSPTSAFRHVIAEPVEIHTWVLENKPGIHP